MGKLSGKIAVVTGGTTGIGLSTARLFAAEGAKVVVTGRNAETLGAAREELKGVAEVVQSDAGDPAQVRKLFEEIGRQYSRIDVLFLNAGIAKFAPFADSPEALFDETIRVNLKGPFLALQAALPYLNKGASVIVNTTVGTDRAIAGASVYSASKAALAALARGAAVELASRGIRVNAVQPGPITTPIFGKMDLTADQRDAFAKRITETLPLGRFGSPDEVARAALFLASDDSAFVTGHELSVDGGMLAA
ncbi:MAG: SDR family oxidoreductase [Deltaproteobacteria bacterium]|nr:MAG: SDR family oxidoreductase [Deltaproteobacteria bacterium]TMB30179.1 MAG: SDR family oxidoreductase [Deltaproteobacteria bacterium]TMB36856.1 MAG: SDR family oxidoreductase [Deltaproteobacteria bacterium]